MIRKSVFRDVLFILSSERLKTLQTTDFKLLAVDVTAVSILLSSYYLAVRMHTKYTFVPGTWYEIPSC